MSEQVETTTTTTTVVQQPGVVVAFPQPLPFGKEPVGFTTPLCGCFQDCEICVCGWLCPCCLGCQITGAMHENFCVSCCTAGGHTAMRTRIRHVYGYDASLCNDACTSCFCYQCSLCQLAREMRIHGHF